ncbi:MAG: hypothetical protein UV02_C0012G0023 [Candidatus Kuenenbacteria bacterium GW2011_GWA2_42_15]|uniref:Uncharacterized protein n=1 Tax=Candidatus Kuenenbacteria bacterium GW2011_GWA2_42_15 TaxID=1618677 RepID=A0A0G0Z184_9BACT|nr:MAG: hypothetical protein UV02_C0012G0023 [Candidatus Kuenenbacteria bacterium GW2011_GWA2_42_15]
MRGLCLCLFIAVAIIILVAAIIFSRRKKCPNCGTRTFKKRGIIDSAELWYCQKCNTNFIIGD